MSAPTPIDLADHMEQQISDVADYLDASVLAVDDLLVLRGSALNETDFAELVEALRQARCLTKTLLHEDLPALQKRLAPDRFVDVSARQ